MTHVDAVPRPTHVHNSDFDAAVSVFVLVGISVLAFPGAIVGALPFALDPEGAKVADDFVFVLALRCMKRAIEGTPAEFITNIM